MPLLPEDLLLPPRPILTVVFALALLPLVSAQSLASKRIVYATWASIATYIIWFFCVAVAHGQGTLEINPGWLRMGTFWQGTSTCRPCFYCFSISMDHSNNGIRLHLIVHTTTLCFPESRLPAKRALKEFRLPLLQNTLHYLGRRCRVLHPTANLLHRTHGSCYCTHPYLTHFLDLFD